jgi:hypothetical protein
MHLNPFRERRKAHDGRIRGFNMAAPDDSSSARIRCTTSRWRLGERRTLRKD